MAQPFPPLQGHSMPVLLELVLSQGDLSLGEEWAAMGTGSEDQGRCCLSQRHIHNTEQNICSNSLEDHTNKLGNSFASCLAAHKKQLFSAISLTGKDMAFPAMC